MWGHSIGLHTELHENHLHPCGWLLGKNKRFGVSCRIFPYCQFKSMSQSLSQRKCIYLLYLPIGQIRWSLVYCKYNLLTIWVSIQYPSTSNHTLTLYYTQPITVMPLAQQRSSVQLLASISKQTLRENATGGECESLHIIFIALHLTMCTLLCSVSLIPSNGLPQCPWI